MFEIIATIFMLVVLKGSPFISDVRIETWTKITNRDKIID